MKTKNAEPNGNTLVSRQMEHVIEPRFVFLAVEFHETGMLRRGLFNRFEGNGHFLRVHEIDNRGLRIAPGQIRQYLVDGLVVLLGAAPELALCNENIALLVPDEDVSFASLVESLSGCGIFKVRLQLQNEVVAKTLLVLVCVRTREPLKHFSRFVNHSKNFLVNSLVESWIRWLAGGACGFRSRDNPFPNGWHSKRGWNVCGLANWDAQFAERVGPRNELVLPGPEEVLRFTSY